MTESLEQRPDSDNQFYQVLSEILERTVREPILLAQLEVILSPRPAKMAESKEVSDRLNLLIARVCGAYGGAPRLIIQGIGDPMPMYDTYMSAAIAEAMAMFDRTHRSLCRSHASMIGAKLAGPCDDLPGEPLNNKHRAAMQHFVNEVFWEHAETTFVRLASFWDRIGQILDFAFFSIRQYERDGFSAVVDRIRSNVLLMNPDYKVHESWIELWAYKKSENEDGLQWLVSRRNLLVHSMHLREQVPSDVNVLFESAFNHLDARFRGSLAPSTPAKEIDRLHNHLNQAARLFPHVLQLCLHHANRETAFD